MVVAPLSVTRAPSTSVVVVASNFAAKGLLVLPIVVKVGLLFLYLLLSPIISSLMRPLFSLFFVTLVAHVDFSTERLSCSVGVRFAGILDDSTSLPSIVVLDRCSCTVYVIRCTRTEE